MHVKNNLPIIFPFANRRYGKDLGVLRADLLLAENIRALLHHRRIDASALAVWCNHGDAWISKIINGERGVQLKDLGRIADFFGLTAAELLSPGISPLTERRHTQRRSTTERRTQSERRQGHPAGALHPELQPRFREKNHPNTTPAARPHRPVKRARG